MTDPTGNAAPPAILVRGLRKGYADVTAVDGVDLEVRAGECFALLGPNGAGKTTTVEILEGYRDRDGGEVSVLGQDPAHAHPAWRARIGIVLQTAQDQQDLTVEEAVAHFAGFYPAPREVDEVIAAVGLQDKRSSRGRSLSGGQRRRLDVALGMVGNPDLLFLDEPTTGFDPEARRQFWDLVDRLKGEGTTILLTTHYLEEAEYLADRVGVIDRGRIVGVDTPANLGQRGSAVATVTWRDGDGRRSEHTHTPTALVVELAGRLGGEVPELSVVRPTLEDVYLSMIGSYEESGR